MRLVGFAVLLLAALPLRAGAEDNAAQAARKAAGALRAAISGLDAARSAKDRVAALTTAVEAYEGGLSALRSGLRQVTLREDQLQAQFDAKRGRLQQLLGVLTAMERTPAPLLLVGPEGPLDTVRSGMIVSDVTPALQVEAQALGQQLKELADLRASQEEASVTLRGGLKAVQAARTELSQAISDRTDLPKRYTESAEELAKVAVSVTSLDKFADVLSDRRMAEANPKTRFQRGQGQPAAAGAGQLSCTRRARPTLRASAAPALSLPPRRVRWSLPPGMRRSAIVGRFWTTEM